MTINDFFPKMNMEGEEAKTTNLHWTGSKTEIPNVLWWHSGSAFSPCVSLIQQSRVAVFPSLVSQINP